MHIRKIKNIYEMLSSCPQFFQVSAQKKKKWVFQFLFLFNYSISSQHKEEHMFFSPQFIEKPSVNSVHISTEI